MRHEERAPATYWDMLNISEALASLYRILQIIVAIFIHQLCVIKRFN